MAKPPVVFGKHRLGISISTSEDISLAVLSLREVPSCIPARLQIIIRDNGDHVDPHRFAELTVLAVSLPGVEAVYMYAPHRHAEACAGKLLGCLPASLKEICWRMHRSIIRPCPFLLSMLAAASFQSRRFRLLDIGPVTLRDIDPIVVALATVEQHAELFLHVATRSPYAAAQLATAVAACHPTRVRLHILGDLDAALLPTLAGSVADLDIHHIRSPATCAPFWHLRKLHVLLLDVGDADTIRTLAGPSMLPALQDLHVRLGTRAPAALVALCEFVRSFAVTDGTLEELCVLPIAMPRPEIHAALAEAASAVPSVETLWLPGEVALDPWLRILPLLPRLRRLRTFVDADSPVAAELYHAARATWSIQSVELKQHYPSITPAYPVRGNWTLLDHCACALRDASSRYD